MDLNTRFCRRLLKIIVLLKLISVLVYIRDTAEHISPLRILFTLTRFSYYLICPSRKPRLQFIDAGFSTPARLILFYICFFFGLTHTRVVSRQALITVNYRGIYERITQRNFLCYV